MSESNYIEQLEADKKELVEILTKARAEIGAVQFNESYVYGDEPQILELIDAVLAKHQPETTERP
jgi:hypothetical protein